MEFQHKEIPLYYQLETILREKIRSGEWAPGAKLLYRSDLYSYTVKLVRDPEGLGMGWHYTLGPCEERAGDSTTAQVPMKE